MPFDGIVMRAVRYELNNAIIGGRIEKIYQPEKDEVIIQLHNTGKKFKLLISANANFSRIHLTEATTENPATPPNFCILLRKYLSGGRVIGCTQPGLERIFEINIESANDIGDMSIKTLVVEVMGKHSNIILLNHNRKIIDSIKHIDFTTSRLREVLPGRDYIYPETQDKCDPLNTSYDEVFNGLIGSGDTKDAEKRLVSTFTGISPFFAKELVNHVVSCHSTENNTDDIINIIPEIAKDCFEYIKEIIQNKFQPFIIYDLNDKPLEYHCILIEEFAEGNICKKLNSISRAVDLYFMQKSVSNKFFQRKSDLIKVIDQKLVKCNKRIGIQQDKIQEVLDRETLKIYGELITSNLYRIEAGAAEVTVSNYYSDSFDDITIKLDSNISPSQNAQRFFKKYTKAKNTFEAANIQLRTHLNEQAYFENILYQIELIENDDDLMEIKDELFSEGLINTRGTSKKISKPSEPVHFVSSDGFNILVGRNNKQNDRLTLKLAYNSDIWLHTKSIPGSHVIIKTEKKDVSDNTLLEAANIAAYFSKARQSSNVPVDYTFVRNIKKPNGAKPGFVIYENFKTLYVTPSKELVESCELTAKG